MRITMALEVTTPRLMEYLAAKAPIQIIGTHMQASDSDPVDPAGYVSPPDPTFSLAPAEILSNYVGVSTFTIDLDDVEKLVGYLNAATWTADVVNAPFEDISDGHDPDRKIE